MFLSRNVLGFTEIIYKTSSAIWNLTTTHIVSQKTIKINVKKPVHWNWFTLLIGDLLGRHFEPVYSYLRENANMFGCFCCVFLFGLPYAGRQQQEVIADSDRRGKN